MDIKKFLNSDDPLSKEVKDFLLSYNEEDMLVDYKEDFSHSEKSWIGITIDICAFANTYGGYLVFGVKDATFEHKGLTEGVVKILTDTNMVIQKVNRYISPPITKLRSKRHELGEFIFAIIHIPESKGLTHIAVKEAKFKYPSGELKTMLRPGMIFVRRSASNQIINAADFEFLLSRRIEHYKSTIFDRIARVVDAPLEDQIFR